MAMAAPGQLLQRLTTRRPSRGTLGAHATRNARWLPNQAKSSANQNGAGSLSQQHFKRGSGSRPHLRWQDPGVSDARTGLQTDLDAVIILAGGQRSDGQLHQWVRRRMEIAADLHRLQGGNKPCKLLCCGGGTPHRPPVLTPQGFVLHEGSELAQFLAWEGVKDNQILKEVASYDTIGNAYFAATIHAIPATWRSLGIVTSAFHMPRSRTIFETVFAAAEVTLKEPGRFDLHFYSASDAGLFPGEVMAARQEREASSLAAWQRTATRFSDLASVHHWLHEEHMCYSVPRQSEFGVRSGKDEVGADTMATY